MINHNNYIPGAIFSGNGISSNFISENPDHNNGLGCWEPHRTLLQPEDCAPGVRDGYQPQPGGAFCTDSGFAGVGLDCPTGSQHAEGPWSTEELMRLLDALLQNGRKWQAVARAVRTRSCSQVMSALMYMRRPSVYTQFMTGAAKGSRHHVQVSQAI
eukprot:GHVO01009289.1.p1 GENE.GHVO01009289.1~~GHVO01009289.1.p1  ORF type:complete len:157 (-),score=7.02 GHVO01009289.1:12-482(-)